MEDKLSPERESKGAGYEIDTVPEEVKPSIHFASSLPKGPAAEEEELRSTLRSPADSTPHSKKLGDACNFGKGFEDEQQPAVRFDPGAEYEGLRSTLRSPADSTPHSKASACGFHLEDDDEEVTRVKSKSPRLSQLKFDKEALEGGTGARRSPADSTPHYSVGCPWTADDEQQRSARSAVSFDKEAIQGSQDGWRRSPAASTPRYRSKDSSGVELEGDGEAVVKSATQQSVNFSQPEEDSADERRPGSRGERGAWQRPPAESTPFPSNKVNKDIGFGFSEAEEVETANEADTDADCAAKQKAIAEKMLHYPDAATFEKVIAVVEADKAAATRAKANEENDMLGSPQGPAGTALRRSACKCASPGTVSRSASLRLRRRAHRVPHTPKSVFDKKAQKWDTRFQLSGNENELKPKQLRSYFSRPDSLPELHITLQKKGDVVAVLRLIEDEIPPHKPTAHVLSTDTEPSTLAHRHRTNGNMQNSFGDTIPWNDRHASGLHLFNDALHPSHRQGFSQASVFEEAPSQRWRQNGNVQVSTGVWKVGHKQKRFTPLGV